MSNNILRFKKDGKYVPVDVNAENVLLKNQDGEYTGENLEDLLGNYHNLEQNYTPRLNMLEASDQNITAQLAKTIRIDESNLSLNNFNEHDRAIIQGLAEGEINAVLGEGNVTTENLAEKSVTSNKLESSIASKLGGVIFEGGFINEPLTSTGVAPGSTRFNDEPIAQSGKIIELKLGVKGTGQAKLKVISPGINGTFSVKDEVVLNLTETGIVTLKEGIDYSNIRVSAGDYLAWYGVTASIDYSYRDGVSSYVVPRDAVGSGNVFTLQDSSLSLYYQVTTDGELEANLNLHEQSLDDLKNNEAKIILSKNQKLAESLGYKDGYKTEFLNRSEGIAITGTKENLFGRNTDFEEGLDTWALGMLGTATPSNEYSFSGKSSVKLSGGDIAGANMSLYKQITLPAGSYSLGFAIYSEVRPKSPEFYIMVGSTNRVSSHHVFPTDKENWWWVDYSFESEGVARWYGVTVFAHNAYYVDAMTLVKTEGSSPRYVDGVELADKFTEEVEVSAQFTLGLTVKAMQIHNQNGYATSYLATLTSTDGTKYTIEYRKSTSRFACRKIKNGSTLEVLSEPVKFNPDAVIGIAIQQTKTDLKLFACVPKGIVIDFDDARLSVYENAFPIMKSLGLKGTTHVITSFVDTSHPTAMSYRHLKELKSNGWTIDSHTINHLDISTLTESEQRAELKGASDWLKVRGFDYDLIATPYGGHNDTSIKLFKELGIKMHRGYSSLGYGPNAYPLVDRHKIRSAPVSNIEPASESIARIDDAMSNYMLMHLTFHGIDYGDDSINYSPDKFEEVMEHITLSNYPTYTFAEILDAYDNGKIIGKVEEYTVSAPSDAFSNKMFNISLGHNENMSSHFEGVYDNLFIVERVLGKRELAEIWGCNY